MNVKEYYIMCIRENYLSGFLLVQLLVFEKKVVSMQDHYTVFDHYLEDRFKNGMNKELNKLAIAFDNKIQV